MITHFKENINHEFMTSLNH